MRNYKRAALTALALLCLNLSAPAQQVTMQMSNVTVKQAINQLKKNTGYTFVFSSADINTRQRVSVDAKNANINAVIKQILSGQNVDYKIEGKNIIITKKAPIPAPQQGTSEQGTAKGKRITGQVLDENGDPMIGVTVRTADGKTGAITDLDGNFTIENAPANTNTLQFSYIGYEDKAMAVAPNMQIKMAPDNRQLNEVVVVGYGTMRKSDLTGSVASANLKDFENAPNTNLAQMLQGTVPGLNVGQTTSAGSTPSISIRGENTISGNSNVLIVLDGIIYNSSLSSINPNDIASVDVLKDASATAVYGAQAANGVLLITTKRGKTGKTKVNFSSSYTFSNPTKNLRPMNREEYLDYTRQFWYDKAFIGPDYTTPNPDFNIADYLPDTPMLDSSQPDGISALDYDWWGEGTHTGHIWENRVSASGGNDKMAYLLSYENTDQSGFIVGDIFKRNSIRINLDVTPTNWLKFGVQSFGSFINQDGQEPNLGDLMRSNPLISPYDSEGNIVPYPFSTLDENPFRGSDVSDKERHNYFFANAYAEIKLPLKGLSYRINFGNNYRLDNHYYASKYAASLTGEAYKHHEQYYDYTVDNILTYIRDFGKHSVNATLLYGCSERKYDYTSADGTNYSRLTLGYNSLQLATNQYINSSAWDEALLYQMGRINYKYDNRYLITATLRRDGYSGFAKNNKFATFPSVALAWNVNEEKFFKMNWVDQLKIRAGWGISGNQTSRYKSLARVTTASAYVFGDGGTTQIGQKVTSMANPDLKWEKTKGLNFGFDFAVLKSRITGTFDCYFNTTTDLLYDLTIPTITGFSSVSTNIGKLRNRGVEFTITSRNIQTKNFEWTTTFNISHNSNKIVTLTGADNDGDGKEDDLVASNLFIGKDISSIYNYKINGIWQLNDDIPTGYHPGNYRVVDTNEDGQITVDDRVVLGKTNPSYRFGLLNSFRWKAITFSFFINSVQGGKNGYMQANSETIVRGDANHRRWNRPAELAKDYWSPSNPDATYSRSIQGGAISPTRYQQRNFVRLQDLNLSYALPQSLLSKVGIENINVFFSGKNLITITKWKGWDPEAGQGYWGRPVLRSFSFGLNLTF